MKVSPEEKFKVKKTALPAFLDFLSFLHVTPLNGHSSSADNKSDSHAAKTGKVNSVNDFSKLKMS